MNKIKKQQNKSRVVRVKAWAVLHPDNILRTVMAAEGCTQCEAIEDVLEVTTTKQRADNLKRWHFGRENFKVVPCEISYNLTTPKRRERYE